MLCGDDAVIFFHGKEIRCGIWRGPLFLSHTTTQHALTGRIYSPLAFVLFPGLGSFAFVLPGRPTIINPILISEKR